MINPIVCQSARELPASFFVRTRQKLKNCLGDHFLALLAAGRPPRRTADEDYPFFANRSFFYTTGIEYEHAILLLYRNGTAERDILFIPAKDKLQERWTGARISRDQAAERSGMTEVSYLNGFEGILTDLLAQGPVRVWLDLSAINAQAADIRTWLESRQEDFAPSDLAPFFSQLRMIKEPEEIDLMRQAIALTGRGFAAMLDKVRPDMMEYQLWSHFQQTLAMEGCLEPAFPSIVAAGENIFCLHYMQPYGRIKDGDLVQIDVGAGFGGLCADISRAFPANGRFSPRQLAIYQLVRSCQDMAFATIRPGIQLREINDACREVARAGLASLGILTGESTVADYFWHSVSHHLGLDVHDVANRDALLQPGMVLTVEPGIYVPEWQVGLRIEDDVLVTDTGCQILSRDIPREAAEIEMALQNRTERL